MEVVGVQSRSRHSSRMSLIDEAEATRQHVGGSASSGEGKRDIVRLPHHGAPTLDHLHRLASTMIALLFLLKHGPESSHRFDFSLFFFGASLGSSVRLHRLNFHNKKFKFEQVFAFFGVRADLLEPFWSAWPSLQKCSMICFSFLCFVRRCFFFFLFGVKGKSR